MIFCPDDVSITDSREMKYPPIIVFSIECSGSHQLMIKNIQKNKCYFVSEKKEIKKSSGSYLLIQICKSFKNACINVYSQHMSLHCFISSPTLSHVKILNFCKYRGSNAMLWP